LYNENRGASIFVVCFRGKIYNINMKERRTKTKERKEKEGKENISYASCFGELKNEAGRDVAGFNGA